MSTNPARTQDAIAAPTDDDEYEDIIHNFIERDLLRNEPLGLPSRTICGRLKVTTPDAAVKPATTTSGDTWCPRCLEIDLLGHKN
ncbi:hypothetical protein [Arthrobacter sp.]|uniref:hypothetical protein n=1 Tax=Arthrobacter sp. TaxID=1667 RepID=UPI003A8F88DB